MSQQSFGKERAKAPDPKEHTCDWCDDPATAAREVRHKINKGTTPTGMWWFACREHVPTLGRAIASRAGEAGKR